MCGSGAGGSASLGARATRTRGVGESWPNVQHNAARRSGENAEEFAVPLLVDRDGGTAEVHLGFSCAPVPRDSSELATAGSLWSITDHTQTVFSQHRSRLLDALTRRMSPAVSDRSVFEAIETVLGADARDLPFTMIYVMRDGEPDLAASTGLTTAQVGSIPTDFSRLVRGWTTGDPHRVVLVTSPVVAGARGSGPRKRLASRIAVTPLVAPGASEPFGVFIGALNPLRPVTPEYLQFVKTFATLCASALSGAGERVQAALQASMETTRVDHTLGAIGHELRTPLNAILAWSQILTGDVAPADQKRGLETIARNARAQAQLLDRLVRQRQVSVPPPAPPVAAVAAGVPDLADLVILVVDDEDDAREATSRTLALAGAAVIQARSAREGWARLEEQPVALIISDISMPGEDGHAFMLGVRNRPEPAGGMAPAIALTSRGSSVDRQRGLRAGFQMYLTKPVESSELILACASLTGRLLPH